MLVEDAVSEIFMAIFDRISLRNMDLIMKAKRESVHACFNGGMSDQLAKQKVLDGAVLNGVQQMIPHDMATILKVLKNSDLIDAFVQNKLADRDNKVL